MKDVTLEDYQQLERHLVEQTEELKAAMSELQAIQRRYIHREWTRYPGDADVIQGYLLTEDVEGPTSSAWLPVMAAAVRQVKTFIEANESSAETTLALPIQLQGEIIGVLGFAQPGEKTWTRDEIAVVEAVLEQLGLILEGQRLFNQTQAALAAAEQQARRLAQLNEMSQQLSQAENKQEVFKIAARHMTNIIQADRVSVVLVDDQGDTFTPLALQDDSGGRVAEAQPLVVGTSIEATIHEKRVIITPDAQMSEWHDLREQAEHGIRSTISAPLIVRARAIGALNIGSKKRNAYAQGDEGMMIQVASLLSSVLENKRLEAERERLLGQLSHLATVVETTSDFVGIVTLDSQAVVYINLAGMSMIGQSGETYKLLKLSDFRPVEVARQLEEDILPVVLKEGIWSGELAFRRSDGIIIPTSEVTTLIRNEMGDPIALGTIARDISERREMEAVLAKRAVELEMVAQVSVVASTILGPDELLQTVVDLTKEQFDLYHAQIYLLDEAGDTLDLAAGAGDVGRKMVAEGWRIPLEREHPLVVRAARSRQGVIVNDVRKEPDFLLNPLLPETRSEMAVPMIVGDRVLGVLDVQAKEVNRFTDEAVRIKTILAVQVAVAVQNARSYAQVRRQAERERLINNITQQLQNTTTVESALQTTIQALGEVLQARHTQVALRAAQSTSQPDSSGNKQLM